MGHPFGDVLATREFTAGGPKGPIRVVVRIGRPYRRRTGEWACPFRVRGAGSQRLKQVYGFDAFQALQLVFQGIRNELESREYRVTWGGLGLDTILPRPVPAFGDEAFTARMNGLIDRELLRYARVAHSRLVKLAKRDKAWVPALEASERGLRRHLTHA